MASMFEAFSRKKISHDMEYGLARVLGKWDLTLLGIGAIIGTGIFVLTGHAAASQAGPAVVLSFVVSGLACAFAALAYAELAASVGGCGSAYGYSYAAFGELIAWIIGWDLILEYGVSVAAVANGWSGYVKKTLLLLNIGLPDVLTKGPIAGGIVNLPAVLIILILMALLLAGIKNSARLNAGMVFIKLITIFTFIAVAIFNVHPDYWHPFAPFGWFSYGEDGKTIGILAGASVVFFAYVGFDAVSTAVAEARDPQKDVPFGILASLIFCTVIYIVVSGLLTGVVHYEGLKGDAPVAEAMIQIGLTWASYLVYAGVIAGLTTVMLVLYYGLTRILLAISSDGLLPPYFATVSGKSQVPVHNTVICGVVMAIMAGFIPLDILAELVNIGTLAAFVLVCGGVLVLRKKHPDMKRPFIAPGGKATPILGIISCGALIAFLPMMTMARFILWLAVGMIIYFGYSLKHSKLGVPQAAE
jgi:basic amino acid/polyamine antiporter, APA family